MNKNPLTREQFLAVNREYVTYLEKEIGQEKAEKMVNDEYTRSIGHPCWTCHRATTSSSPLPLIRWEITLPVRSSTSQVPPISPTGGN